MNKTRILIVEDDKHISKLLRYNLEKSGHECTVTGSSEQALKALEEFSFQLIILDIMLPKMDGLEFCKLLKQNRKFSHIPIMILTAKGDEIDRIIGFELGADDYVVKPFSPRELVLRVKAITRRGQQEKEHGSFLSAEGLQIDLARHKILVNRKEVNLTQIEFKLLEILVGRMGLLQTRDKLLEDVWDMSSDVTTRTIDTHIKKIRRKLGKIGDRIETIRGMGYRFSENE